MTQLQEAVRLARTEVQCGRPTMYASALVALVDGLSEEKLAEVVYTSQAAALNEALTWAEVRELAKTQPWQEKATAFIYAASTAIRASLGLEASPAAGMEEK